MARSLAEIRFTQAALNRERLLVSAFIEELAPAATLGVNATFMRRLSTAKSPLWT